MEFSADIDFQAANYCVCSIVTARQENSFRASGFRDGRLLENFPQQRRESGLVQLVLGDGDHGGVELLLDGDVRTAPVALHGEKFDGHQFIAQAKLQGAVAVLCEPQGESLAQAHGLSALVVPDWRLASWPQAGVPSLTCL